MAAKAATLVDFDSNQTNLILIDNKCKLDLNNCFKIICDNFEEKFYVFNNSLIEKDLLINHLPLEADADSFDANIAILNWTYVAKFKHVLLITDGSSQRWKHDKIILAIFYKIITDRSMILLVNESLQLACYYPYFLEIYYVEKMHKYKFDDLQLIDDLAACKKILINTNLAAQDNASSDELDAAKYQIFYQYLFNGGKDVTEVLTQLHEHKLISANDYCKLVNFLRGLNSRFNHEELKFYDAEFRKYPSLTSKLQISIAGPCDEHIYVYAGQARDYNFRSFRYKNVLAAFDTTNKPKFVFPTYQSEQSTRQTIRFLIMNLYYVYSNSALVDLIVIYLFMKVTCMDEVANVHDVDVHKLVKTKYKNVYQLFAKRHETTLTEYIAENKHHLPTLGRWFKELTALDQDELEDLFTTFVADDCVVSGIKYRQIIGRFNVDTKKIPINIEENKPDVFTLERDLNQHSSIQITADNWPQNENFKYDDDKLQLNASFPFFICCKTYADFVQVLNEIEWMDDLRACLRDSEPTGDKIILKGGAILDLMSGRKPKDYDLMNISMDNEQFFEFLTKFVKKTKPDKMQLINSRVVLFRVTMKCGDVLEFVMNSDLTRERLFSKECSPDQICFLPLENKLLANEYTLWSINYGYCRLSLDHHSASRRLSTKMRKLGFNFFYEEKFAFMTKFLKERLERYVWRISEDAAANTASFSRQSTKNTDDQHVNRHLDCTFVRDLLKNSEDKLIFANKVKFYSYISEQIEQNKKNVDPQSNVITLDLKGAIILPETRFKEADAMPSEMDWSY